MTRRLRASSLLLALLLASPGWAPGAEATVGFTQGRFRLDISAGTTALFNQPFFIKSGVALSVGAGYYVFDNVEVGLDSAVWIGSDPFIAQLGPHLQYVLPASDQLRPFAGVFYRHWFLGGGFDDMDAAGGLIGVHYTPGGRVSFSLGVAYERIFHGCSGECAGFYPVVGASVHL